MAEHWEEQCNSGDTTIPIKIYFEIPNFYGNSSVRMWIKQCEKCFSLLETPNEQKVDLAYMCMFDRAYMWAQNYICNNLDVEWPEFVKGLCDKFGTIIRGDIMDIEKKEFKQCEDSLEEYLSDKIQDYEDFFNNSMEHKEKDEIDVMQHKEKGKSIRRLEENVKKMMQAIKEKDEIDVLGEAEMVKEGVVDVVLDSADTSSEPASEDVSLGVNLFAQSEILGDAKQVFDGNLDKGSMKDNTQSAVMHKEGQLCQAYEVLQFSGLEVSEKYGSGDSTSKKGWKVKITPWRDKSIVVGGLKGELAATAKRVIQGLTTELSSVGLVYKHFGPEIIAKEGINQYDNESENGWTAKPIPWRDKNAVLLLKPRGLNQKHVWSALYGEIQYCGVYKGKAVVLCGQ